MIEYLRVCVYIDIYTLVIVISNAPRQRSLPARDAISLMGKECGKLTLNDVAPANRARCPRQMRDKYTKKSGITLKQT